MIQLRKTGQAGGQAGRRASGGEPPHHFVRLHLDIARVQNISSKEI